MTQNTATAAMMAATKIATRMAESAKTKTMMEMAINENKRADKNVHSEVCNGYDCSKNNDG